jgi:hypothetical protein
MSLAAIVYADSRNDRAIRPIAHGEISSNLANYFAIEGDTAYVVTQEGLEVFDLDHPRSPKKIGQFDCGGAFRIDVEGGFAYAVLGDTAGVTVIDISRPGKYVTAGRYQTPETYTDIVVRGKYMYLLACDKGLEIVDISDPSHPEIAGRLYEPGDYSQKWMGYTRLVVDGNYAFVGQSEHGVKIIDLREPARPRKIATIPASTHIGGICVQDSLLVLSAMNELSIYDLADIHKPKLLSVMKDFSALGYTTLANSKLVVYDDRLVALDISNPRAPKIMDTLDQYSHRLRFHDGYLYSVIKGIDVFDVSW